MRAEMNVKHLGVAVDVSKQDLVAVHGGQQVLHVGRPPSQMSLVTNTKLPSR